MVIIRTVVSIFQTSIFFPGLLARLLCDSVVSILSAPAVKRSIVYFSVPEDEEWRVQMLQELFN